MVSVLLLWIPLGVNIYFVMDLPAEQIQEILSATTQAPEIPSSIHSTINNNNRSSKSMTPAGASRTTTSTEVLHEEGKQSLVVTQVPRNKSGVPKHSAKPSGREKVVNCS